jgi:DNA polymerase I-like protein with 3'-5' exonuclease and polymerase domains
VNLKAAGWGIVYGLAALWLANNSNIVRKVTAPMGKSGGPLLPF